MSKKGKVRRGEQPLCSNCGHARNFHVKNRGVCGVGGCRMCRRYAAPKA